MNRREFIARTVASAGILGVEMPVWAAGVKATEGVPLPQVDHVHVKPRNRRPYQGLDWAKTIQINGTTHIHDHGDLPQIVKERHLGFLTVSNYYPSMPMYPWREALVPRGVPVSDWPVLVNGKMTAGPFDWNEIIKPWENELGEGKTKNWTGTAYPFKPGRKEFKPDAFPADMLEAPNAEHHSFLLKNGKPAGALHLCAPGSAYISGTFDAHDSLKTNSHGYCFGSGEFWGTAIDRMIEKLIVPEGGGVTINHPHWSVLKREFILELLDWDPRVLGLEVIEACGHFSENYWDWALSTGRQCFGFFVPDHDGQHIPNFGVNVLCVPERTQAACLKAYREGNFYGAAHGYGELKFTHLSYDGATLTARTDKPAHFEVKTASGIVQEGDGTEITWTVKKTAWNEGPICEVFARVKATAADGCGEILFSQPFMLY